MRRWVQPATFLLSAALHAVLLRAAVSSPARASRTETVEIQVTESRPPPPPAARSETPLEPRPAPRRKLALAPVLGAPPSRHPPAPPPPSSPPPRNAPQGPVRIGISMSSTTEAGAGAATVGNTLHGPVPDRTPDGEAARPYRSDHHARPSEVASLPEPISIEVPQSEYPQEAKRLGFEGAVRLLLMVDEEGRVRKAAILADPGHGLGPAAARVAERYFRFRPAQRAGEAVATEIPFTVHFQLS